MINKILKFLKIHFSSTLTLRDGTPVELSGNLETGVNAFIVTQDGKIAMPDGEYSLSDDSIILVKDGIITDVVNTGDNKGDASLSAEVVEEELKVDPKADELKNEVVEPTEEEHVETVIEEVIAKTEEPVTPEVELQKGNPDVSGEETVTPTGKTETEMAEPPMMEPTDGPDEEQKIMELENKIASLELAISEIMKKLNLISEKFSAAQPIVKRKETDTNQTHFNQDILDKVELIKKLRKS